MNIDPSDYEILVVDDIPSNVLLLKAILTRHHFNIVTASNGREAIEIIEKKAPDLALVDVMMPEINGYDLCRHIREKMKLDDLPIILLTALNDSEDIVIGFEAGANDFVSKPFNNEVLLMRIRFQLSIIASKRLILKQAKELSATISSRDKLYSVIAHDLRSPLATLKMILNYVSTKISSFDIDEDLKDMISTANSISEDAFNLFDNLLKWTKSQNNMLRYVPQKIEVTELVESSIEILKGVAYNKGITIITKLFNEKISVEVDIDMIKTVFRNILSNAIKFSEKGSNIILEAINRGDNVLFNIIDQGKGMDRSSIEKIESGKVDFTSVGTNNESGSGLGLMLTREFIIRNGGTLSVHSVVGEGSTFSFYIPILK